VDETNQQPDPLEAELAAFRPRPMSPGLQSRIDATLAEPRQLWRIGAALLTFAAAACVVIVIGLRWSHAPKPGTNYVNTGTRPSVTFQGDTLRTASPPSVVDYQRAFAESSDAFDALLARPAGSGSAPVRAFSFPSPDSINLNNTGDQK
jgi:hypothetical protein